jgi:hypothetical protein
MTCRANNYVAGTALVHNCSRPHTRKQHSHVGGRSARQTFVLLSLHLPITVQGPSQKKTAAMQVNDLQGKHLCCWDFTCHNCSRSYARKQHSHASKCPAGQTYTQGNDNVSSKAALFYDDVLLKAALSKKLMIMSHQNPCLLHSNNSFSRTVRKLHTLHSNNKL